MLHGITPLVLTWNEAPNIGRCLERLSWAPRVVVLDSGSTDETIAIAAGFSNVQVRTRSFDNHANQWNFGIDQVETPWVLALDADYILPADAESAIAAALGSNVDAADADFRYCVFGRPLSASLYPPRAVLFKKGKCRYEQDGHTQRLVTDGRPSSLRLTIDHDDRKPLKRWLASQAAYAELEAEKLLGAYAKRLAPRDRLRRTIIFGPPLIFCYALLWKRTLFDGWRGWYYAFQRGLAEVMLSLVLLDKKLRR